MSEASEMVAEVSVQEASSSVDIVPDDLEKEIINQLESYFCDHNMATNKFIRELVKLDDGWVSFEMLSTFNFLAFLTKEADIIANAMSKSTSGLIELSDDKKKMRRRLPVPGMHDEDDRKEIMSRTIYVKGFPGDINYETLLRYFSRFEDIENILMRKYPDNNQIMRFKGSVYVTFQAREQAEAFMNIQGHKYQDTDLLVLWQDDHQDEKRKEYITKMEQKILPLGTILHYTSGNGPAISKEYIEEALRALGADVAFTEYMRADGKEGWVRLSNENTAQEVADKMINGRIRICGVDITFRVLEGEEERAYLEKIQRKINLRLKSIKNILMNKGRKEENEDSDKRTEDENDAGPSKRARTSED